MSDVDKRLKQFGGKHSLEVTTISLDTEQEPKRT